MSMPPPPPPNWSALPIGPLGNVGTFAELGPRKPRFKVGMALVIIATVAFIGLGAYMITSTFGSITGGSFARMPGELDIACHTADQWRIGPQTGSTSGAGPVTITSGNDVSIDSISAAFADGSPVEVSPMNGSTTESFSIGGATFTAVATFTCPSAGTVKVAIRGTEGAQVAAFRSVGQTFRRLVAPLLLFLGSLVVGVVGLVMAITGRRKPVR
jgi:hypothetical protein